MKRSKRIKKKIDNFLFDHPILRNTSFYTYSIIFCLFSAFLLAFSIRTFITPSQMIPGIEPGELPRIVSGGISGVSQNIVKIFQMCGVTEESLVNTIQSTFYAIINIPLIILAFLKIGKKFAIFSAINVVATSLFIQFLPSDFIDGISLHFANQLLARGLFAGIFSGLSTAIAFKVNQSAGGLDILSFYFAARKNKSVGSYIVLFNACIIGLYAILSLFSPDTFQLHFAAIESYVFPNDFLKLFSSILTLTLFSVVYMFAYALVVDLINARNKKVQVQIITEQETLSDILIANFPHSATVLHGTGAYSKKDKTIIYMVVSTSETKHVVKVIQTADPNAFINIINLQQVYGKFFIRPMD